MSKTFLCGFHSLGLIAAPAYAIPNPGPMPQHPFPAGIWESVKFKSILASVEEIGVIEPLVVYEENGKYLLLDGHLRLQIGRAHV